MMPGIMNQLGPDSMKDLKRMMGSVRVALRLLNPVVIAALPPSLEPLKSSPKRKLRRLGHDD